MSRVDEIRKELAGKTEMNAQLEEDLFGRICELEEDEGMIKPMTKADRIIGILAAVCLGILPLLLVGTGIW